METVSGYGYCRLCDALTPLPVLNRTGRICEGCVDTGLAPTPLPKVRVGSVTHTLHARTETKGSKGSRHTKNAVKAAKEAAMRRLRDAYPEVYRMMYIEERARRGLDPVPLLSSKHDGVEFDAEMKAAGQLFDLDGIYAALSEHGIEED